MGSKPILLLGRFSRCLLAGLVGLLTVAILVQILGADRSVAQPPTVHERQPVDPSPAEYNTEDQWLRLQGRKVSHASAPHLGYGINVRDPANIARLVAPLGFEWVKLYELNNAMPKERLPVKVLYRIEVAGPPSNMAAWGDHVAAIAAMGRGFVEAYEIGNEPNQRWQWGDQVPDPNEYVSALKVAYARIKAVDPDAIVVSAGLGPVGRIQATPEGEGWPGNNGHSMDEWEYSKIMFAQCPTGCFDAFGYHPTGYAYPPETDPASVSNNFAFRGAEDLRKIMVAHGVGDKPMWATEFGWIRDPEADGYGWCKQMPAFYDYFGWMLVSEQQQADYLRRAFAYADAHWPWMEAMFVWNLDWNDQNWECEHVRFFSIRHVAGDPAQAYGALAALPKRPGPVGCRLSVDPVQSMYLVGLDQSVPTNGRIEVDDMVGCDAINWSVALHPSSTFRPGLSLSQGRLGEPLAFTLEPSGIISNQFSTKLLYTPGTYTSLLTINTLPQKALGSPQTVPIEIVVAAEISDFFLPVISESSW